MSETEEQLYTKIREQAKNTPEEWGKLVDVAADEIVRLSAENERLKARVEKLETQLGEEATRCLALEGHLTALVEKESKDACPKCGARLKAKWSGVECTKCGYWFCY